MSKETKKSVSNGSGAYTRVTTLLLISVSVLSLLSATCILISQQNVNNYSTLAEQYSIMGDFIYADIQAIMQTDTAKYQTANTYLQDLLALNEQVRQLKQYNQTAEGNGTLMQTDVDMLAIEFVAKMAQLMVVVEQMKVYHFCTLVANATVANNYTYMGAKFHFITNLWVYDPERYDQDIKDLVNATFSTPELPKIEIDVWTTELFYNTSISLSISHASLAWEYNWTAHLQLDFTNRTFAQIEKISEAYTRLADQSIETSEVITTSLIAFALSAVILGFVVSVVDKKYRKISIFIAVALVIVSIFLFAIGLMNLMDMPDMEAERLATI